MSIELKIKSKHLALEPAIIRTEEHKLKKRIEWYKTKHQLSGNVDWFGLYKTHPDLANLFSKRASLQSHRCVQVREEARATYLARAYLKGMPYKVVEAKTIEKPPYAVMQSLIRMVMKYGSKHYNHDFDKTTVPFKVVKKAEDKAKEDIVKWLDQE